MTKAKRVCKRRPLPCRATDLERSGSGRSDPIRCALFPFEACLLHEVVVRTVRLVPEVHSPTDLVRTEEQAVHRRACPVAYCRSICSWQRLQEAEKERLWFEIESQSRQRKRTRARSPPRPPLTTLFRFNPGLGRTFGD